MNVFAPDNEFDQEVNNYLLSNTQDNKSNVLSTIVGGTVASAVDIGATLFNSLPGVDEVDTEQILGRIGGDALRVYQENPETIQTISLIGGALLPGAAAVKGMNALRNGSKAVNWFTTAGKQADIAKAAEMVANGAKGTAEYKKLLWGMRGKTVANNLVDTAVGELAILGAMNSHVYMEDYFEDPAKNFAISMAIGGGLGTSIGLIADNFALKKATAAIEESAFGQILSAMRPIAPSMPNATQIQEMELSISNLKGIMAKQAEAGKNEGNDLVYQMAAKFSKDLELEQTKLFDSILPDDIKNLPQAEKDPILQWLKSDNGAWGVEKINVYNPKELVEKYSVKNNLTDEPQLTKINTKGEEKSAASYYIPEVGKYGTIKDVEYYAGVSSTGLKPEQLAAKYPDKLSYTPQIDYSIEVIGKSTAAVESDYAGWMLKYGEMDDDALTEYLKKAVYSPDDAPQLQALYNRLQQSPKLATQARIKVASQEIFDKKQAAILGEVDARRTLGGTPVKYQEALERTLNNNTVERLYDITEEGGTRPAAMISAWRGGRTFELMKGATAYFARGYAARSRSAADIENAKMFAEIYEHPKSVALRTELSKLADADGKIYLYRGVTAPKIFGQSPLESMAVTTSKTAQFAGSKGKTLLYKVDVEDVVASIVDVGPAGDNVEVIVRTTAREAEAVLDANGSIRFRQELSKTLSPQTKNPEVRFGDVADMLNESKYKVVRGMITRGFPVEVIAKRANIPLPTMQKFLATDLSFESFEAVGDLRAFKTVEDVKTAMAPANRPLKLQGNMRKHDYTKNHANLNAATLTNIDGMFKATIMANSASSTVRELAKVFFEEDKTTLDLLRTQLSKITNEAAGNRFFTSADQFARKMGDVGPIASYIGKRIEKIANATVERVLQPITDAMTGLSTNKAALTEFGIIQNLNAGLKGWRTYKDGQLWQKVERIGEDGKKVTTIEPVTYRGAEFKVVSPEVDKLMKEIQAKGQELYDLSNSSNKILGKSDLNNIGLWMPAFNPVNKFIAYVHDIPSDTTRVIYGRTPEQLEEAKKIVRSTISDPSKTLIVDKSDQEWWSRLNGRLDTIRMEAADVNQLKTGSGAQAMPTVSTSLLSELAGGYEHYINSQVRNLADLSMSDITDTLRDLSSFNQRGFKGQPLSFVKEMIYRPKDAAKSVENILLSNQGLGEYSGWKSLNTTMEGVVGVIANGAQKLWQAFTGPVVRNPLKTAKGTDFAKLDYEAFEKELAEAGVPNPFDVYDRAAAIEAYGLSKLTDNPDVSKRVVAAGNAVAATLALRFAELAHPIVNLISMPILMTLSNSKSLPATFMGVQKGTANVPITQVIMEGARAMNSPRFKALSDKWEELGYYKPLVSEASEIIAKSRQFEPGAIAKVEKLLESNVVTFASKPADLSESLSRKYMMHAGAVLAKRLYPELDDNGVTIFARDFMDKALGNYSATQRPVFFQGTFGVAMGLFQTYMVTLAQSIYRNIEFKDWKTLAKGAMTQSTIFGTSSLPGFDPVSEMIAEHYSDDNVDLTTGTFRALGDDMANWVLYGLPSNLSGAGFYTRGDVDPRFPNVAAGLQNLVGVNFAAQTYTAMNQFAKALKADNEDVGTAMLQALSLQSMSRPIARLAELKTGYSITQQGNTVQIPDEVMTFTGIAARALGTRPLEEAKLREAMHLNRYYETIDRDNRQNAMNELRTAIRNGTVTDEKIAEIAERYMRFGGSPRGWRSAYNNALAKTEVSGEDTFLDKLDEDSPFRYMINNLD